MTKSTPAGSSLSQTLGDGDSISKPDSSSSSSPDSNSHARSHAHSHNHQPGFSPHHHRHHDSHHHSDIPSGASSNDIGNSASSAATDASDHDRQHLDLRQEPVAAGIDTAPFVTQVIQTVSLVQYVDASGRPIQTQTLLAPPNTVLVDPVSGNTIPLPVPDDLPAPTAPAPNPAPSDDAAPDGDSESMNLTSPLNTSSPAPTQNPLPPLLPPPSSDLISALPLPISNSLLPAPAPPTADPSVSSFSYRFIVVSKCFCSCDYDFKNITVADFAIRIDRVNLDDDPVDFICNLCFFVHLYYHFVGFLLFDVERYLVHFVPENPSSTSGSTPSGDSLSPEDRQVIGGVVGGIAGAALFAVLILFIFRRRRGKGGLFGVFGTNNRGLITDGGSASGPAMTERSPTSAVSATLSRLTSRGPPPVPATSSATGERGFYRVSGRKLPSVLQVGGDGYTDPRESVMSGVSDYYRGSQEFNPGTGGSARLALGSPMRPVSGIPIMRTGPVRHVVPENPFESNPFLDPSSPPPTLEDPLGRTLVTQDGSRGSGSRFQERL
ncbi:hypothetical protein B0I35DRAFT_479014 [Stachybotrys elegans]|uniref:Uncharacterized protein n=1 Tax=Stachybotrys elegans TaxID=80388 RepID=A0A8K0SWK0_9HYPO|nr:hypothetical protein B0I35DRAFT_479014 [Stachybotrys elegans]